MPKDTPHIASLRHSTNWSLNSVQQPLPADPWSLETQLLPNAMVEVINETLAQRGRIVFDSESGVSLISESIAALNDIRSIYKSMAYMEMAE